MDTIPFGAMTNPLQDLEDSDVILVIGSNPSASHPVAAYKIKRAARLNGARLIVVDPIKHRACFVCDGMGPDPARNRHVSF